MSQISPPLRILLVGSLIFMAAWFTVLKPGGGEDAEPVQPAATAPQSAPGEAAQAAKDATQATGDAAAARAGETAQAPATSTQAPAAKAPAPAAAPEPKAKAAVGLPVPVAKALAADKVLVLYFWNPKAADDRAVRAQLRGIDRHKGAVAVHVAKIDGIARYAPITRGVDVEQSPSVVVVDRKRRADLLTGYVDRVTIDQAVSDALRAK